MFCTLRITHCRLRSSLQLHTGEMQSLHISHAVVVGAVRFSKLRIHFRVSFPRVKRMQQLNLILKLSAVYQLARNT